jgi:DNA-binding PadR family transcriptional regulator
MAQDNGDAEALLPLTPAVFQILLALSDGERHGYAIMREIEASTQGQLRIGPGTLYRSIKQMLAQGLIAEADERPDPALDDERRRYYRLTNFGQRVAAAEARRLARLVAQARQRHLLDVPGFDPGFDPGLGGAW